MTAKDVRFSTEARERMLRGVEILADPVKATLGPRGRNVLIEQEFGPPRISKDGVTVAEEIELPDRFENMGAGMVCEVATRTSADAMTARPPPRSCASPYRTPHRSRGC